MKWIFFVWDNIPESLRLKIVNIYLVGGIPTPLKNMSSSAGIFFIPNRYGKITQMFQTTNQEKVLYCYLLLLNLQKLGRVM